jgi:hypothetical protein
MEAMRCLKRRLSEIVYQRMLNGTITHGRSDKDGPGRATGKRL